MILFHGTDDIAVARILKTGLGLSYPYVCTTGNTVAWYVSFPYFDGLAEAALSPAPAASGEKGPLYCAKHPSRMRRLLDFGPGKKAKAGWLLVLNLDSHTARDRILGIFRNSDVDIYLKAHREVGDHEWLWRKRLPGPEPDSTVITKRMEPGHLMCALKMYDYTGNRSSLAKRFRPERRRKLKHKTKDATGLIWEEVHRIRDKWSTGIKPVIVE